MGAGKACTFSPYLLNIFLEFIITEAQESSSKVTVKGGEIDN